MRKSSREAYQAFISKEPYKNSNTAVHVLEDGGVVLFLHGNIIAKQVDGILSITTAGWPTNVTKERLNALPGVRIHQSKGVWFLNDIFWDGAWITIDQFNEL